jgi:hypothetical protein
VQYCLHPGNQIANCQPGNHTSHHGTGLYTDNFAVLPADGTRGGIILGCSQNYYMVSQIDRRAAVFSNS